MDQALIGLAGIVVGALLAGTGKYFVQRRDAWARARASGLLLLADINSLCRADSSDPVVVETAIGTKSWRTQRETLVGFRRGVYPNGLSASEWLALSAHFARLQCLDTATERDEKWWAEVKVELVAAQGLLADFVDDPAVVGYVIRGFWRRVATGLGLRKRQPVPAPDAARAPKLPRPRR